MLWCLYAELGVKPWSDDNPAIRFEDEAWDKIIEEARKEGINTVLLELGEGVKFASHPELARAGAWSRSRVRSEVVRLKKMGITIIPKMNFSATHHHWLGEYSRMMSTKIYYRVCREIISEVYELFDKPQYIHLGMDEEGSETVLRNHDNYISYRRGELLWHDFDYLCECVRDTGAIPWVWSDLCFEYPEEFRKRVKNDSVLLSPWYYFALKEEHYTVIADDEEYREYYSQPPFKYMDLKYVEDEPFNVRFREQALPAANDGYGLVPCVSTWNRIEYNTEDTMWYFKTKAPEEAMKGYMTAPWLSTTMDNVVEIVKGIRLLGEAKRKYYGN